MPKQRLHCNHSGCTKSYCSSFNLKRHIESTHQGIRRFKCHLCGRHLSSKQNLIDHQNIHSGAKPYSCDYPDCEMKFRQLSQYYLHRQLHNEISNIIDHQYIIPDLNTDFLVRRLTEGLTEACETYKLQLNNTNIELPLIQSGQNEAILPPYSSLL